MLALLLVPKSRVSGAAASTGVLSSPVRLSPHSTSENPANRRIAGNSHSGRGDLLVRNMGALITHEYFNWWDEGAAEPGDTL